MKEENIIKNFRSNFGEEGGCYYGKDSYGDRIFIPDSALEDIEKWIIQTFNKLLTQQKQEIIREGEIFLKECDKEFGTEEVAGLFGFLDQLKQNLNE